MKRQEKKTTAPVDLRVFFITILILNTVWIPLEPSFYLRILKAGN
jgi:hypothetical protein